MRGEDPATYSASLGISLIPYLEVEGIRSGKAMVDVLSQSGIGYSAGFAA